MRRRGTILLTALGVAVFAAACGRASDDEINDLLGIVPTPTLTGAQIAMATSEAQAEASAQAAALESGSSPVAVAGGFDASEGNVTLGRQQLQFQCQQCHRPDGAGAGPALAIADSPVDALTDDQVATLVRDGHGGADGYTVARLNDDQLASIIAFIRQQSE